MHEKPFMEYEKMTKAQLVKRCEDNAQKIQTMHYDRSEFLRSFGAIGDLCSAYLGESPKHFLISKAVIERIKKWACERK